MERQRSIGPDLKGTFLDKATVNAWNEQILKEFRENNGVVGGPFQGATLLILHTTGAKSGAERLNPLVYLQEGDVLYIFGSRGGDPSHPDWYHNLVADPNVTVEVGTETVPMRARVVEGAERDRIYDAQVARSPMFDEYRKKTTRVIPVVALEPR